MKVTAKLRRQILDRISDAVMGMYDDFVPEHKDGPPECWDDSVKRKFDLITEAESRITSNVDSLLIANSYTKSKRPHQEQKE